jgi:hypothetical protein
MGTVGCLLAQQIAGTIVGGHLLGDREQAIRDINRPCARLSSSRPIQHHFKAYHDKRTASAPSDYRQIFKLHLVLPRLSDFFIFTDNSTSKGILISCCVHNRC